MLNKRGKFVETQSLNENFKILVLWRFIATLYNIASVYCSLTINISEIFHGHLIIIKSDNILSIDSRLGLLNSVVKSDTSILQHNEWNKIPRIQYVG